MDLHSLGMRNKLTTLNKDQLMYHKQNMVSCKDKIKISGFYIKYTFQITYML